MLSSRSAKRFLFPVVGLSGFLFIGTGDGSEPNNPLYNTLDAVAGGIEKVISIAKHRHHRSSCDDYGCDAMACDDGCDAGLMQDLEGEVIELMPPTSSAPLFGSPPELTPSFPRKGMPLAPPINPSPSIPAPSKPHSMPHTEIPAADAYGPMETGRVESMPVEPLPLQSMPSEPQPLRDTPRPSEMLPTTPPEPNAQPKAADDWLDNFSNEPAAPSVIESNKPATPSNSRKPADTFNSLPNPFQDDAKPNQQGRRSRTAPQRSFNQPASYWAPW